MKIEKQVFIDGKIAKPEDVSPAKHAFIGNFRSPEAPCQDGSKSYGLYLCPCGAVLGIRSDVLRHWHEGHMDIPQYKTI
jgi:hypothetical protein